MDYTKNTGYAVLLLVLKLAKRSFKAYLEDDMPTYAGALAFRGLLALFPFIIFLIALLGFLRIPGFFDWLLSQSSLVLTEQAMGEVEQIIGQIRDQAQGGVLSLSIALAIWSISAGVRQLITALNAAYEVEEARPAWKRYPLSIAYTLALAVMVIIATLLMWMGPRVWGWIMDQVNLDESYALLWEWARWPIAVLLLTIVVATIYYAAPSVDRSTRIFIPGSVIVVPFWIAVSLGFSYYVKNFSNFNAFYGSLGAIVVLLLYFFLSAAVLLMGAEINSQIRHYIHGGKKDITES